MNAPRRLDGFLLKRARMHQGFRLDFGCGAGEFLAAASHDGIHFDGADTFEGIYEQWKPRDGSDVMQIVNGRVPKTDHYYSYVACNQVLEHIPGSDVDGVSGELARLLKPGGECVALFPLRSTLIEAHVGVIGAHWFLRFPRLLEQYLRVAHQLGFGYWRGAERRGKGTSTAHDWAEKNRSTLLEHCHYVTLPQWRRAFSRHGLSVHGLEPELLVTVLPRLPESLVRWRLFRLAATVLVRLRLGAAVAIRHAD